MSYLAMWGVVLVAILLSIGLFVWGESEWCPFESTPFFIGGWGIALSVIWIFVGLIIAPPFSYVNQISNVENIQAQKDKIEIQYDRLERLSSILEKFNYPDATTLANADTPIGSVVEEISAVEKDIADRREKIVNLKRNIRERSAWIYGFTTEWYPLEE